MRKPKPHAKQAVQNRRKKNRSAKKAARRRTAKEHLEAIERRPLPWGL